MRSVPPIQGEQQQGSRSRVLSQNLLALGFTSFFSDISSEMVTAAVPLFLTAGLGFTLFGYAAFAAAYEGTNAFFRIWGGAIADNRQSHKRTAATGYSISALTRVGLVFSSLIAAVPAIPFLLADRIGKGLRTAPRDALISLSTAPNRLAQAFGVHRAMDTAGAMIGPLLAYFILRTTQDSFDSVFVVSAMFAAVGVSVITLFAQEKPQRKVRATDRPRIKDQWRTVAKTKGMPRVAAAVAMLSLLTVGDALLYLVIIEDNFLNILGGGSGGLSADGSLLVLLPVGTATAYLLLAMPVGRLADRFGTRPVFLGGHVFLIAVYLLIGFASLNRISVILCLSLFGAYYAATDGVVPAMVSRIVGPEVRASGIAFITVIVALGRIVSALLFATLIGAVGTQTTMVLLALTMLSAIIAGFRLLSAAELTPDSEEASTRV